jgi:hypothetical protein
VTAREKPPAPHVTVEVRKHRTEMGGPVRITTVAARHACGDAWTFNHHDRTVRVTIDRTADVLAALDAMRVRYVIKGSVPDPELFA